VTGGIGGRLLDAVLSYADEHDFARIVLNPCQRAIPFYERAGFSSAHTLLVRSAADHEDRWMLS
jgi:GNAT superfamily N-acetyltransferase